MSKIAAALLLCVAVAAASRGYRHDDRYEDDVYDDYDIDYDGVRYGGRYGPHVDYPSSHAVVVGGRRRAGAEYDYRDGFENAASDGQRRYEHKSGYGWAREEDESAPSHSRYSRRYSTANARRYGFNDPRNYRVHSRRPARRYRGRY